MTTWKTIKGRWIASWARIADACCGGPLSDQRAAAYGLLNLREAFDRLMRTECFAAETLLSAALERHANQTQRGENQ